MLYNIFKDVAIFLRHFRGLLPVSSWVSFSFGVLVTEWVAELWRLKDGGVFCPKFSASLEAKLYVGCETVFEVQTWYGAPVSPCCVWLG